MTQVVEREGRRLREIANSVEQNESEEFVSLFIGRSPIRGSHNGVPHPQSQNYSSSSDSWPSSSPSPSPSTPNPPNCRLVSLSLNSSSTIDTLSDSSPSSNLFCFSPSPLKLSQTSNWVLSNTIAVPLSSPFCSALSHSSSSVSIDTLPLPHLPSSPPGLENYTPPFSFSPSSQPQIPHPLSSSPTRSLVSSFGIFLDPPSPASSSATEILPLPGPVPRTIDPKLLSLPCVYPDATESEGSRVIVLRSRKVDSGKESGKGIRRD